MSTEPALRRQFRNFDRQKLGYGRLIPGRRNCFFGALVFWTAFIDFRRPLEKDCQLFDCLLIL